MKICWKFNDEDDMVYASLKDKNGKFRMIYYWEPDEFKLFADNKDVLYIDSFVDRLLKWSCL